MCYVKFGHVFLRLENFPTSNCVDVLYSYFVGYFVIGEGEGAVDEIILIKYSSKILKFTPSNLGAYHPDCLRSL